MGCLALVVKILEIVMVGFAISVHILIIPCNDIDDLIEFEDFKMYFLVLYFVIKFILVFSNSCFTCSIPSST